MPVLGFQDTYLDLPEAIRAEVSLHEWAWLSNAEKQEFLHGSTTPPEDAEDGPE